MNINATLIVQAIHFGIVYYTLRVLVLKPAYTLIKQERDIHRFLQESIDKAEHNMHVLHEKQYQLWHAGHRFFVHTVSSLHTIQSPSMHAHTARISAPDISLNDSKFLVEDLELAIINRLKGCR